MGGNKYTIGTMRASYVSVQLSLIYAVSYDTIYNRLREKKDWIIGKFGDDVVSTDGKTLLSWVIEPLWKILKLQSDIKVRKDTTLLMDLKFDINNHYTPLEIMTRWGISKARLDGLRKEGHLTAIRMNRRIYFAKTEVEYVFRKLNPTGYVTMAEARKRLGISMMKMMRWRQTGKIALERTEKHWICREEEVQRLLEGRGRYDGYVYTIEGIAKAMGVSEHTLKQLIKSGKVVLEKHNRRTRLSKECIDALISDNGMVDYKEAVKLLGYTRMTFHEYCKKGLIDSEKGFYQGRVVNTYNPTQIAELRKQIDEKIRTLKKTKMTLTELVDTFSKTRGTMKKYLKHLRISGEMHDGVAYYDRESTILMIGQYVRELETRAEIVKRKKNAAPDYGIT